MASAPAPAIARPPAAVEVRPSTAGSAATRQQLRGSSLLLTGRLLSLVVNFATQVLIVRYLSKTDFGAFAYGLSIVSLGESVALLGLDKAIPRFLPIYEEQGAFGRMFGTLLMAAGTVVSLGLAFVLLAVGMNGFAGHNSSQDVTVVLILICLSPIQALDDLLIGAFAVFSKPRAIFFRRYVLAPGLRLAAIALVVLSEAGVRELAVGYVAAGAFGVVLYTVILIQTLRADGRLAHLDLRALSFPAREVFGFAIPLITVDLLFAFMNTANVWMLEHFGSTTDVADYRVVQPAAKLNLLVMTSFTLLFTPVAARLFAQRDRQAINELYWRTAAWMAVFSFPVFALTFACSHGLTVGLFGERYASSAPILTLLALGYYVNAALGFNGLTLRVYGLVRYVVVISVAAAVANIAVNLLLIPRYGALGAAVGTCVTLVLHNVLKQAGLRKGTGIGIFDGEHRRVYGAIVAATVVLVLVQWLLSPPPVVAVALVAIASSLMVWLSRDSLRVGQTFPELLRVPVVRRLVS